MIPSDLQTEWARLVVDALARAGVRDVVLSPGSRSTPLVLALVEHRGLRISTFIDERVAAFYALGQARASGVPSALVCTSGSAPAHYFPAIVEAGVAHVPLVVLSADRPVAMLGCGESQTIDQVKLFGDHVRHFVDLGAPGASAGAMHALRRHVAQAVARSKGPLPGPVHLDVRATRPLEPEPARTEEALATAERARALREQPGTWIDTPTVRVSDAAIDAIVARLDAAQRVLVVAGPAPLAASRAHAAVSELAQRLHAPVCAEGTSQLRFGVTHGVLGFDAIFRTAQGRRALAPDLVLQLEGAPIAKGLALLDDAAPAERIVIASHGHPDPTSRAAIVATGDVVDALARITARVAERPDRRAYLADVLRADALVATRVQESLASLGDVLTEGAAVHDVVARASSATFFVGNSLPVRELDTWTVGVGRALRVLSQRGASGIDGNLAGAAGSASVIDGPVVALVGDVTFLHDIGGLAAVAEARSPVVIVVINNGGGRIFEQLPIGQHEALRYFTTPHDADLAAASAVHGLSHVRVQTRAALASALREACARPTGSVVEVVVPPSDAVLHHRALWADVDALLADAFP